MNKEKYYATLDYLLTLALEKILRQKKIAGEWLVKEFIDHGEYGLAFDFLECYIEKSDLQRSFEIDEAKALLSLGYENAPTSPD
jgi:hypothetical protein